MPLASPESRRPRFRSSTSLSRFKPSVANRLRWCSVIVSYSHLESPLGVLLLASGDTGLCEISFPKNGKPVSADSEWHKDASALAEPRSEERRVGKECRSRWSPY